MTRKGGSKHLKRLPSPANWPIHKKEFKWIVKPKSGPHSLSKSWPLILVIRESLGLVKNSREAKMMVSEGHIKVDGRVRRKADYPVGIMDVIEIPTLKKVFRVLPSRKRLRLYTIDETEQEFKLCKIVGKTTVKDGQLQLHVHDGKNILVKNGDSEHPLIDVYKVHDALKIKIPDYDILSHLKFEEGILGIIDSGKNSGTLVEVTKIYNKVWPTTSSAILQDFNGNQFETILDYIFPIGKGEPWISLPEGNRL